jgi:hypothetical protein
MARKEFTPMAAEPIRGKFNAWPIEIAPGLVERLSIFDPLKLGAKFYPGFKEDKLRGLLLRSVVLAQSGIRGLEGEARDNVTFLRTSLDVGHRVGFDPLLQLPIKDSKLDLADNLPLSEGYKCPLGPRIMRLAEVKEEDDLDPYFMFLAARFVQTYLKVDRSTPEAPKVVMFDADVSARPAPWFRTDADPQPEQPGSVLMLTPAQRNHIRDLLGMSPKLKAEGLFANHLPMPKQDHARGLAKALKAVAPVLLPGGGKN